MHQEEPYIYIYIKQQTRHNATQTNTTLDSYGLTRIQFVDQIIFECWINVDSLALIAIILYLFWFSWTHTDSWELPSITLVNEVITLYKEMLNKRVLSWTHVMAQTWKCVKASKHKAFATNHNLSIDVGNRVMINPEYTARKHCSK